MPYSNKVFQIGTNSGISFRILRYLSYKIQLNQELFRSYTRYDSISILRYYLTRYNSIPLVNIWGKGSNTVIKAEYYSDWRLSRFTENVYRKKSRCVQVYKNEVYYDINYKPMSWYSFNIKICVKSGDFKIKKSIELPLFE